MLPLLLVELDGLQPSSTSNITKLNREKRQEEGKRVSLQDPSSVFSFFAWCEDSISSCRLENL